jgi:hypothetical protein
MWEWLNCHLLGRHEYVVLCEGGVIFLRCHCCGRRSNGWEVQVAMASTVQRRPSAELQARPRALQQNPLPLDAAAGPAA